MQPYVYLVRVIKEKFFRSGGAQNETCVQNCN
jgi:hypothetical protein